MGTQGEAHETMRKKTMRLFFSFFFDSKRRKMNEKSL